MRCLTRRPELTEGRFGPDTEVVAGDVLDQASMRRAMAGVDAACYLVHALGSRGHFEQEEERAARSFVAAAREAGVRRIVYLGGLAHPDELARQADGSAHMRSRLRVGELLRGSGVPTVELRAISAGGWYYANALWRLRGVLDRMLGGVGMKRGRRDPEDLRAGDVLDCWRVVACEAPRVLSLEAEMRLPGRAWLQFEVTPCPQGASIRQTAVFDPVGLGGLVYWYVLYLPHLLIFRGMLVAVAERAGVADGQ